MSSKLKCRMKDGVWFRRHKWDEQTNVCKRCKKHRNPKAKPLKVAL